jgi:hypothetical protein
MKVQTNVKAGQVTIIGDVSQTNTNTTNQTNRIGGGM